MAKDIFTAEWFPYYFERFNASGKVALMSLAVEGAYHRAIRHAWKYGTVPSDPVVLAALIQKRCTPKIAAEVLTTFETVPNDPKSAYHPIVEEIRAEQAAKSSKYSNAGKAGAAARWGADEAENTHENAKKNGDAIAMLCDRNGVAMGDIDLNRDQDQDLDQDLDLIDSYTHACVREHPGEDPRLVEIAVLETMLRRKDSPNGHKPIRSPVKYFAEEIANMLRQGAALGDNARNALLLRRRNQLGIGESNEQPRQLHDEPDRP